MDGPGFFTKGDSMSDDKSTIPAPPPDEASLPDVVKAELERLRQYEPVIEAAKALSGEDALMRPFWDQLEALYVALEALEKAEST